MQQSSPVVRVSRRGADRLRAGHPWIYRSDLVHAAHSEPGDIVRVLNDRERAVGWAFWSSTSQIALRSISSETAASAPDERKLFASRIAAAARYRAALAIDATAYRLVHGESDRLPGLIVDRYADGTAVYLVIQTLTQATDRRLPLLTELLREAFAPAGILARNDPRVRRLEGLDERVEVLHGEIPDRITVREGRVMLSVDLKGGQKTGAFLDQRENHDAARRYARGRVLDAFTYNGGFALQMAAMSDRVLAIDSSAAAVALTAANANANGLANIDAREGNVFDELRELETSGAAFDTIVLDPPAFAKNKASVDRALAGYKEINLRALALLAPGGHLITCSCSYNVSDEAFLDVVRAAAADARVTAALVEKRLQARDHPVLVTVPETSYLKCLILRRVD